MHRQHTEGTSGGGLVAGEFLALVASGDKAVVVEAVLPVADSADG